MPTDIVSLERELARIAQDFAVQLIRAALRARVDELDALRESSTFEPAAFPVDLLPSPRPRSAEPAPLALAFPRQPRREPSSATPVPVIRRRPARRDDPEDDDTMANMITDPGLLLDVIEAGVVPSQRPERVEVAHAGRSSKLLRDPVAIEPEQGPALRPGERLQRTAGGNVVLRRGGT